jgi:flavin-dependent thymidylate synthase
MSVELLFITPGAEALIAQCARVSHRSEGRGPESDRALIRRLISLGHESVLEHAVATFEISGISRACANQLTRHRLASFVQESQRYVNTEDRELVRPPLSPMETGKKPRPYSRKPRSFTKPFWRKAFPRRMRGLCCLWGSRRGL